MSSGVRRAHPTGYKSSTRNADIWQQWFLDYGRAHGYADASAIDQRIREKVRQHRSGSCPKVFVSDVSVARGSLDGQPSIRVSTGVFHHVPYYKWRAPNVIESFARPGDEKSVAWRRQASHRRKMDEDAKRWAQPTMMIPMDRAVRALSYDLAGLLGCQVHALVMDAQWYVGGPTAKMPGSGRIYRFKRQKWFYPTRKACHASFWLGSPKILVDARLPFIRLAKFGHRNFLRFIVSVANMYVGPDGFLKAVRIELKGRMGSGRKKTRLSYIAGWGDSLVADARTVRSYWRDTTSRRGTVRLRVTYFYAQSVVDQEDNVQAMSQWLGDLQPVETDDKAEGWTGWCLKVATLLQSWEEERRLVPTADHWGFEIETLSQHLDLFRKRGMDRFGFWKRPREHPSYRYEGGQRIWKSVEAKWWGNEMITKTHFTRRMEEFSGQLPALLEKGMPAALGERSRTSTDYWTQDPSGFALPHSAGSIPIMYGFRGMGRFQRNQLLVWKRRRRSLKVRFGMNIWHLMEAIDREMKKMEEAKRGGPTREMDGKLREELEASLPPRPVSKGRLNRVRRFKNRRLNLRPRFQRRGRNQRGRRGRGRRPFFRWGTGSLRRGLHLSLYVMGLEAPRKRGHRRMVRRLNLRWQAREKKYIRRRNRRNNALMARRGRVDQSCPMNERGLRHVRRLRRLTKRPGYLRRRSSDHRFPVLKRLMRRMGHSNYESPQQAPKNFVPCQTVPTPWWFSHLEGLHMKRQYWKTKKYHQRFIGWGPKRQVKTFFMAWLESQGVRDWQEDEARLREAVGDTKTHEVMEHVDRARIKANRPRKRKRYPFFWNRSPGARRAPRQRSGAFDAPATGKERRQGSLGIVRRSSPGPKRGSIPLRTRQGVRLRVRKFLESELNLAV